MLAVNSERINDANGDDVIASDTETRHVDLLVVMFDNSRES